MSSLCKSPNFKCSNIGLDEYVTRVFGGITGKTPKHVVECALATNFHDGRRLDDAMADDQRRFQLRTRQLALNLVLS